MSDFLESVEKDMVATQCRHTGWATLWGNLVPALARPKKRILAKCMLVIVAFSFFEDIWKIYFQIGGDNNLFLGAPVESKFDRLNPRI